MIYVCCLLCRCLKNSDVLRDGLDMYILSPTRHSLFGRWCRSVDGSAVLTAIIEFSSLYTANTVVVMAVEGTKRLYWGNRITSTRIGTTEHLPRTVKQGRT